MLDHGHGTVIGETCEIGDDCYLLQSVILGATGIVSIPSIKRHPSLGNNVRVGGFARIFGPVNIGDNVLISPHCVITTDIPSNSKVRIVNQLQITTSYGQERVEVYGIVPKDNGKISIFGCNLDEISSLKLVNDNFEPVTELDIETISVLDDCMKVQLSLNKKGIINKTNRKQLLNTSLQISGAETIITITRSRGLFRAFESLMI